MKKSYSFIKLEFDRLLSKNMWIQFIVLGGFLFCVLIISYIPFICSSSEWSELCGKKGINPWLMPIYLLIDSNALNSLYTNNEEGLSSTQGLLLLFSSIVFLLGAIAFSGFIIGIITNSIERRVENHKQGHIHYLKSGHYIIMGYDDMVPSIILHIFERDKDAFVLLMSAVESDYIREKLRKVFNEKQLEQIIINYGHRTSKDYYNDIHLESANRIYIVGLRSLPSHDAINVECVDSICDYLEQPNVKDRPKRITCVFEDLDTYAAFKTSEIFGRVKTLGIEFIPYNFYAGWAKQVFVKQFYKDKDRPNAKIKYPSVYGKGHSSGDNDALTENDTRFVHLVFVGTTNFAVAFAMEAAQVLHLPNGGKVKTLITFIDKNADEEKNEFIIRNRHLFEVQSYYYCDLSQGEDYKSRKLMTESVYFTNENGYTNDDSNFLDIEFEFIKGDVFSKNVQDVLAQWSEEHHKTQYLSIFLAMANQRQNFVLGMNMPDAVYDKEIPVFIRQDHSDNFVSDLRVADDNIRTDKKKNSYFVVKDGELETKVLGGRYAHIYPFGMNGTAYCADEKSLKRAKLMNYLYSTMPSSNKFQSIMALDAMSNEQIWAEADKFWQELSVALKWSSLYNAYTIRIKLAFLRSMRGLALDDTSHDTCSLEEHEVDVMAYVEHNRWNVEKLLMGYRKARKDEDKYNEENCDFKDKLKKNKERFIHHDIRPYDKLDGTQEIDKEFCRYIPWIIKMTED